MPVSQAKKDQLAELDAKILTYLRARHTPSTGADITFYTGRGVQGMALVSRRLQELRKQGLIAFEGHPSSDCSGWVLQKKP